ALDILNEEMGATRQHREEVLEKWRESWLPLGIVPLSPAEMTAWHARQLDLVKQAQAIRERAGRLDVLERSASAHRADLDDNLRRLGLPGALAPEALGLLINRC